MDRQQRDNKHSLYSLGDFQCRLHVILRKLTLSGFFFLHNKVCVSVKPVVRCMCNEKRESGKKQEIRATSSPRLGQTGQLVKLSRCPSVEGLSLSASHVMNTVNKSNMYIYGYSKDMIKLNNNCNRILL